MSWIILALTLGASITSIIHGVFMLFGSLSVSGGAVFGIPSTLLASLPVISAVFALVGGITAFNQNKWGAVFLFIAMGLCVPSRDTWLYGGLYFFAGLLCFFLKPKQREMYYDYDDEYDDAQDYPEDSDFYYDTQEPNTPEETNKEALAVNTDEEDPLNGKISINEALQLSPEPPKLRRRMSKSCPECGAIVSRENRFCPTCGAKLSVLPPEEGSFTISGRDDDIDIEKLNDQLLTPMASGDNSFQEQQSADDNSEALNTISNDGDDMTNTQTASNYRVTVKPGRNTQENSGRGMRRASSGNDTASSYQEFSKITRKAKKRGRSAGRKVLSMLLLVAAVGGALYFLLGLRKLPPGDLPPIARTEVAREDDPLPVNNPPAPEPETPPVKPAEPVGIAVAENVLPNFTPDREPRNGIITGNSVNVRADHNTSSSRVTRLKSNTRVEVIGTENVTSGNFQGIWYNIRTGGHEGWVYGKYLQPLGSGLPSGYSSALLKSFGGTKNQLVESLGNPSRSTGSTAEWPGITATLKGNDVTKIRITSAGRELQNGLKTGMSQTALLQIMGYPSSQNGRTLNYNENGKTGLAVQLDRSNIITTITVNEI